MGTFLFIRAISSISALLSEKSKIKNNYTVCYFLYTKKAKNRNEYIFVTDKIRNILKKTSQSSFLKETWCSAEEAGPKPSLGGRGKRGTAFSVYILSVFGF